VGFHYDDTAKQRVPTGRTEAYTLTCKDAAGNAVGTPKQVVVDKDQTVDLGAACA
jgi:hypothetical protein